MKKTITKFALRKETLRALSSTELEQAAGGESPCLTNTRRDSGCSLDMIVLPGDDK
jgi:hypothetical protein